VLAAKSFLDSLISAPFICRAGFGCDRPLYNTLKERLTCALYESFRPASTPVDSETVIGDQAFNLFDRKESGGVLCASRRPWVIVTISLEGIFQDSRKC
jgi:hypothetical protein